MSDQSLHPSPPVARPPVPAPPQPQTVPRLRAPSDKPMLPAPLLYGMVALVVMALSITTYARLTDQPLVGVPQDAPVLAQRSIVLDGNRNGAVVVRDEAGAVILDLDPDRAGFISVIWRGLDRRRMIREIDGNPPVSLVRYANGRLSLQDPASGWSAELASFGDLNEAAFTRLID